jgi:hypothetical protein
MKNRTLAVSSLIFLLLLSACRQEGPNSEKQAPMSSGESPQLTSREAARLIQLPLDCIQTPFPYKPGLVIDKEADLSLPSYHHPAFYGCFDWHSAVHGHWVIINLLRRFPDLPQAEEARRKLSKNLSPENIQREIEYFSLNPYTRSFERTYGWAWLLKLCEELYLWKEDTQAKEWYDNLRPLADLIVRKYMDFLPRLNYPIRVGEHTNTAFGLTFAWDFAQTTGEDSLRLLIERRARGYYLKDQNCPLSWEPSGFDFLSPCLQEADLMNRVLEAEEFESWFSAFAPSLLQPGTNVLEPAVVRDRTDGKLVHLDGLNFSRAWCLYHIARDHPEWGHLKKLADQHLAFSLPNIVDGEYAGEHWLATFALYALNANE